MPQNSTMTDTSNAGSLYGGGMFDPFSGSDLLTPPPTPGKQVDSSVSTTAPPVTSPVVDAASSSAGTGATTTSPPTNVSSPSWLDDLTKWFNTLTGLTPAQGIADAAAFGVVANQVKATQAENKALADRITAIGQPDVTAGADLLNQYTAGQLAAPYQTQVDIAKTINQQAAISQEQQSSQLLAGASSGNVQGAMAGQYQQITNQQALQDTMAVSNAFTKELADSINLTNTGGQYVLAGIQQEIQSNTQLSGQLADLMGNLAKAFAEQQAGNAAGGGSGGGGGSNPITAIKKLIDEGKNVWNTVTDAFGAGKVFVDAATGVAGAIDAGAAAAAAAGIGDLAAAGGAVAASDLAALAAGTPALDASVFGAADAAGAGGAGAAGAAGGGFGSTLAAVAPWALGAAAIYGVGQAHDWFGGNSASSIKTVTLPKDGSVTMRPDQTDGSRNVITTVGKTSGAMMEQQVSKSGANHDPGDPVLYPKGASDTTGTNGWALQGFNQGAGGNLATATWKDEQSGQTLNTTQLAEKLGMTLAEVQDMYSKLTGTYTTGRGSANYSEQPPASTPPTSPTPNRRSRIQP